MNESRLMGVDYWHVRALSEQLRREREDAARTQTSLNHLIGRLRDDGIIDLTDGEWIPDDQRACFVRRGTVEA